MRFSRQKNLEEILEPQRVATDDYSGFSLLSKQIKTFIAEFLKPIDAAIRKSFVPVVVRNVDLVVP